MSCCGKQRIQFRQSGMTSNPNRSLRQRSQDSNTNLRYSIRFEYTGKTSMTVIGGVSGTRYRFERPGMQIIIDPRDRISLSMVPNLKEVR
jgi:hypothetical protein